MTSETIDTLEAVEDFTDKLLASKRGKITQDMISDYVTRQLDVGTLRKQLKNAEDVLEAYTKAYVAMLKGGNVRQVSGELALALDVTERQTAVKWKEKYAAVAGPKAVEQAQLDAGKTTYEKIIVVSTNPTK